LSIRLVAHASAAIDAASIPHGTAPAQTRFMRDSKEKGRD
jgi:hypothetical protein